jgi:uncharacterized GH25 family protein
MRDYATREFPAVEQKTQQRYLFRSTIRFRNPESYLTATYYTNRGTNGEKGYVCSTLKQQMAATYICNVTVFVSELWAVKKKNYEKVIHINTIMAVKS